MDQPKDAPKTPKKSAEKKAPPQSNNMLWYLLGLGVLLLLLVTVWQTQNKLTIQWSDLEALIVASNPDAPKEADPYITFEDKTVKPSVQYRLKDPTIIRVGSSEITGTVMAQHKQAPVDGKESILDPNAQWTDFAPSTFRTAASPYTTARALKLLRDNKIDDYSIEEPPSQLLAYIPVLVLTGMFVMLMIVMLRRMGGAGSPMAFGRSRGKLIAQEDIEVTFDDVAGIEEAVDELDALGKTRGSGQIGGHDEREQTLNALLVEMDGFGTNSGIIIMAATNRPETLDPALLRPGRFDRHVLVDRPDVGGREEILEVHLQKIKVDEDVNVKQVAAITSGFVGADLANIVNEAALLAARNGKKAVGMTELNEAVERSSAGLEKKSRIMQPEEKLRVAYHESGHALVAYSLPNTDPVHKVSIIPRGLAALGYTMQRPEQDRFLMTKGELESRIQVLLAGTVAEEMVFEDISSGAQNDLERATEIARSMVMDFGMSALGRVNYRESNRSPFLATGGDFGRASSHSAETARQIDEEVKRILDEGLERVRHILAERRHTLEAVTKALMEQETIDSDMLRKIIDETSSGARIVPGTAAEPKRPSRIKSEEPAAPEKDAGGL